MHGQDTFMVPELPDQTIQVGADLLEGLMALGGSFVGRPNSGSKKGANSLTGNSGRICSLNIHGHDRSSICRLLRLVCLQGSEGDCCLLSL